MAVVDMGRTQAVADLNKLVEDGVLERVGGGRSTIYQIPGKKRGIQNLSTR